jgi:hypothetical protein
MGLSVRGWVSLRQDGFICERLGESVIFWVILERLGESVKGWVSL